MNMFLGCLGLIQIGILPGFILLKAAKIRGGLLERLIYLFPLSLITNYGIVFTLCLLRIYNRTSLIALIVLEVLTLIFLNRSLLSLNCANLIHSSSNKLRNEFHPLSELFVQRPSGQQSLKTLLWILTGLGSISAILWGCHLCRLNIGTVFTGWDTVLSWNQYAVTWADGSIPLIHGMYPQLIPANWSISYVLLGNTQLQLFNTFLPALFFLWIMLTLFDLGFQERSSGYFLAAIFCRFLMKKILGDHLFDGYMDVPAACMILLSFYAMVCSFRNQRENDKQKGTLLSGIFACGAAITKQIGFIAPIVFPVLLWQQLRCHTSAKPRRKTIIALIATFLLICVPWYAHCFAYAGNTASEGSEFIAAGIVSFNQQYEWSHKFFLARQMLGSYAILFLFSLIGLPWVPKGIRLSAFLYSWPVLIIWILFFTYDTRNMAAAIPFVAISTGSAFARIIEEILSLFAKIKAGEIPFVLLIGIFLILCAAALIHAFPNEELSALQKEGQKKLFGAQLNQELLYGQLGEEHSGNDILTNYPAPYLSGYQNCCSMVDFKNSKLFEERLQSKDIHYLLSPQLIQEVSWDAALVLERCLQRGRCSEIACSYGYYIPYCLYAVNNP